MRVSAWCSRTPYLDHLAPIWAALPEEAKGRVYVHEARWKHATDLGLSPQRFSKYQPANEVLLIFSRMEFAVIPQRVPLVFMEHGVGANYGGRSHLVASRNPNLKRIIAVLTTPAQAPAHRRVFGDRVHVVGCPKLDGWHGYKYTRKRGKRPVVAFSHHWNQKQYQETRSAWPWDAEAWARVVESGRYEVVGHKHPGDPRNIEGWCKDHGIEFVENFDEVMRQADLYVADNSSTLYEFAATGRPVVVLSPPFYRRDVNHGIRFWDHVSGVECAIADHLGACIEEALKDVPARKAIRQSAVEAVYGPLDGRAAERCVEVLMGLDLKSLRTVNVKTQPIVQRTGLLTFRHTDTGQIVSVPAASSRVGRYQRSGWEPVIGGATP